MPNNRNAGDVFSTIRTASILHPEEAASPVHNWQHVGILSLQPLARSPGPRPLTLGPTVPLTLRNQPQPRDRLGGHRREIFLVSGWRRAISHSLGVAAMRNMAVLRSHVFLKNVMKALKIHSSISTTDTSTNPTLVSCLVGI
jgi:hypothetical protein